MSLFILHELEVAIEDWRHAWDEVAVAALDHLDAHRRWFDNLIGAPIRAFTYDFVRLFSTRWAVDIRRREERKNLKRRRAARARCGRR